LGGRHAQRVAANEVAVITVCPNGGLGNQLFQYAAGRALALHHGVDLEIDTWHFGAQPEAGARPLLLHKLGLPARWRLYPSAGLRAPHSLPNRVYRRLVRPISRTVVRDDAGMTGEMFFAMSPNSLLHGYFQSLRYLGPFADRIRHEVALEPIASPQAVEFGRRLKGRFNCAIHIRRGDYVSNPFFDIVDWSTYLPAAIDYMGKSATGARFIVFSDDPEWCRCHPLLKSAIIHDPSPSSTADAMYLMTLCSHHIISNSSYGWWGAYLANPPEAGRVVAPPQWFRGHFTSELGLCAPGWHLL
jgi:Glycosyl transferase family 11